MTLEQRIAQAQAHRGYAPNAPASEGIIIHNLHVTAKNDQDLIDRMQRRAKQAASQRRGRHGGSALGIH
jgi:hypothetical protein